MAFYQTQPLTDRSGADISGLQSAKPAQPESLAARRAVFATYSALLLRAMGVHHLDPLNGTYFMTAKAGLA